VPLQQVAISELHGEINSIQTTFDNQPVITFNVPIVYMGAGRMDLDGGVIHNKRRLKGWALKSRHFWALKWQRALRVPFGPKKVHKVHKGTLRYIK
jgi:hypothetical protein